MNVHLVQNSLNATFSKTSKIALCQAEPVFSTVNAIFSFFSDFDLKYVHEFSQHRSKGLWMSVVTPQYTLKQEIRTLTKLQENTWTGSKSQIRQDCFSLNC